MMREKQFAAKATSLGASARDVGVFLGLPGTRFVPRTLLDGLCTCQGYSISKGLVCLTLFAALPYDPPHAERTDHVHYQQHGGRLGRLPC